MKPSAYELLIQVNKSIDRLEDKMDQRLTNIEKRTDILESFQDNLQGRIAMGVLAIGAFVSIITAVVTTWINDKIFK
jgi:hypothetical protein